MKYMGSKNRYYKYILPIILENRLENQYYVEPFVGGFNIIQHVKGNRVANDSNKYLIALFKAIQEGWIPPDYISEEEYKQIRQNKKDYSDHIVGFVGFGCSYSGKFFGGYARGKDSKGQDRNYCLESKKNILKQASNIKDILIYNKNYDDFPIPPNSIIYCDPPYENTTKYINTIDYKQYWNWIRSLKEQGHVVFVSEYEAPEDFTCVWCREVNSSLTKETGSKKAVERLFTLK